MVATQVFVEGMNKCMNLPTLLLFYLVLFQMEKMVPESYITLVLFKVFLVTPLKLLWQLTSHHLWVSVSSFFCLPSGGGW